MARLDGKSGDCYVWLCRCDCGNEARVKTRDLKSSNTRSCGCLKREQGPINANRRTHGGWKTPEFAVWQNIIQRCEDTGTVGFHNYGDRGIQVCQGWRRSFVAFRDDMGNRPSRKHSIDRIDNERGYDCGHCEDCKARGRPANCRWATSAEQARNKRTTRLLTFNGETLTLTDWANRIGISVPLLHHRLKAGWHIEEALTKPADRSANHRHRRKPDA